MLQTADSQQSCSLILRSLLIRADKYVANRRLAAKLLVNIKKFAHKSKLLNITLSSVCDGKSSLYLAKTESFG